MERITQEKLELFADNVRKAKKGIRFKNLIARRTAAYLYALEGKPVDCDAVLSSYAAVKGTGMFSRFRGSTPLCIAAMLSLRADSKTVLERTVAVHRMMMDAGFKKYSFLALAAYFVASGTDPERYQQIVDRMKAFNEATMVRHKYVAIDRSYLAALLSMSDADMEEGVKSVEMLYERLKSKISGMNKRAYGIALIAIAGGMSDQMAAERIIALRDAFKAQKRNVHHKMLGGMPSTLLGALVLPHIDANILAQETFEALTYLKAQKGLRPILITKQEVLVYAAAIVASRYADDQGAGMIAATTSGALFTTVFVVETQIYYSALGVALVLALTFFLL